MNDFLLGAFAMASAAISVFFYRYFKQSDDRLFLVLSFSFALLALERTAMELVSPLDEERHWLFVLRLSAFLLIILGILDKNRSAHRRTPKFRLRRLRPSSL